MPSSSIAYPAMAAACWKADGWVRKKYLLAGPGLSGSLGSNFGVVARSSMARETTATFVCSATGDTASAVLDSSDPCTAATLSSWASRV